MDCTQNTLQNTGKPCIRKNIGLSRMFLFSTTKFEIADIATAQLEATIDALILAKTVYPVLADEFLPENNEMEEYTGQFQDSVQNVKGGKSHLKIQDPTSYDLANFLMDHYENRDLYLLQITEKNIMIGEYASDRVKVTAKSVTVTKMNEVKTINTPEFMVFRVQDKFVGHALENRVTLELAYNGLELVGLSNLTLSLVTASISEISVKVFDTATGTIPITDLITADFIVKSAAGVVTAATAAYVSDGQYTLTGTFTTAETSTVELATPTVMNKLYDGVNVLDAPVPTT